MQHPNQPWDSTDDGGSSAASRELEKKLQQTRAWRDNRFSTREDFSHDRPDFPEELVSCAAHPEYVQLEKGTKLKVLTGHVLSFLGDTIPLEEKLLHDAASAGQELALPEEQKLMLQVHASVEESGHALQSRYQHLVTRQERRYTARLPHGVFVMRYERANERASGLRKLTTPLAYACMLEVDQTVLFRAASSLTASPWQTQFHAAHWMEEKLHQSFFLEIAESAYRSLDLAGRAIFAEDLYQAAVALGEFDADVLRAVLSNAGVAPDKIERIVADTAPIKNELAPGSRQLFEALGLNARTLREAQR